MRSLLLLLFYTFYYDFFAFLASSLSAFCGLLLLLEIIFENFVSRARLCNYFIVGNIEQLRVLVFDEKVFFLMLNSLKCIVCCRIFKYSIKVLRMKKLLLPFF